MSFKIDFDMKIIKSITGETFNKERYKAFKNKQYNNVFIDNSKEEIQSFILLKTGASRMNIKTFTDLYPTFINILEYIPYFNKTEFPMAFANDTARNVALAVYKSLTTDVKIYDVEIYNKTGKEVATKEFEELLNKLKEVDNENK